MEAIASLVLTKSLTALAMVFFSAPKTATVNIIERFGKFHKVGTPGLSILIPCLGFYKAGTVSLKLQMLHVTCETKTMDNVLVTVEVAVQYRVPDAEAARLFFYSLTEPEAQMDAIIHDTIRSLVPKFSLDDLFRSENGVSVALSEQLGISFGEFGVEVKASPVTSINFADEVKEANNRIQTMQRLRMAASDEAEAAAIKHMKWANATAAAAQIRATADADVCHLRGVGVARQRAAMLDGMKAGLAKWEDVDGLDNKYVLAVMMQGQYVSAMQAIGEGDGSNTIFVPSSADESSNLTQTLRETIFCGEATKKAMNPSSV